MISRTWFLLRARALDGIDSGICIGISNGSDIGFGQLGWQLASLSVLLYPCQGSSKYSKFV